MCVTDIPSWPFLLLLMVAIFPVASLPAGTSWVDVSGGFGHVLLGIAQVNLKLKFTLQDQQHVLDQAKQFLKKEYLQGVENNNPHLVPLDFLKESPVKGQDIYYMRFIIHDWPDDIALVILKNVAKAMKSSSRLLIHDFCLTIPSDNSSSSNVNAHAHDAPPPLLPNYGAGGARPFLMDVNIMIAANSKERSAEDVADLADRAGLEFVRFWDCVETGITIEYICVYYDKLSWVNESGYHKS
ncbi:hypothetical protein EWM64_g7996 [Hericium alpestre]|uniref:O-methyltransferase C-terminal domain-containing protein n=1 Tax=Hericium alpestre TaxID=135208 RepID=A0A4Y9ZP35_9AGAM|nr:hypothetical protein EWM64_g7996 [Hericium alpestre]